MWARSQVMTAPARAEAIGFGSPHRHQFFATFYQGQQFLRQ